MSGSNCVLEVFSKLNNNLLVQLETSDQELDALSDKGEITLEEYNKWKKIMTEAREHLGKFTTAVVGRYDQV